jgi:hypothetical protein
MASAPSSCFSSFKDFWELVEEQSNQKTPKDFWDLIEWEQSNQKPSMSPETTFEKVSTSVLLGTQADRRYQLHKSIQQKCPMLSGILKDMGARISEAEERIARTLIPLETFITSVDIYGKPMVLGQKIRAASEWQDLIKGAIDLEKFFNEAVRKKDPDIDRGAVSRVGATFTSYISSMVRSGWEPNKELPNPLHRAAQENCPLIAEAIIIRNADLNSLENGETPLSHASRLGHSEVVRILQKHMIVESSKEEAKQSESDKSTSSVPQPKPAEKPKKPELNPSTSRVLQPKWTSPKPEKEDSPPSFFNSFYNPADWMI